MAKEIHLYMGGQDPVAFAVDETILVIHTGLPGAGASPVQFKPPDPPPDGGVFNPDPLAGGQVATIVAPESVDDMRQLIEQQAGYRVELDLALDPSVGEHPNHQFSSVIDGVAGSEMTDLIIHLHPVIGVDDDG